MNDSRQWLYRIPGRCWVIVDREEDICFEVKVDGEWVKTEVTEITNLKPPTSTHRDALEAARVAMCQRDITFANCDGRWQLEVIKDVINAYNGAKETKIGDVTMARVFGPNKIENLSDLQTVFDAVEVALTPNMELVDRLRYEADAMYAAVQGEDYGDTFHRFNWDDKPHRVVYAAVDLLREAADAIQKGTKE